MSGIYLHIPFCKQACHYCNFHFSTSLKYRKEMVAAICTEIERRVDYLPDGPIETIYFGGGTPSILNEEELAEIFATLEKHFTIAPKAEITLEANPDDLSEIRLKTLKDSSVNRLSIGVQSFFQEDLAYMNRAHDAQEAERAIELAHDFGFKNISIDLIYGAPTTTDEQWAANVDKLIRWKIPHLSCYALTVEPGTALDHFIKKGTSLPVDEAKAARQFTYLMNTLEAAGYEHYEISNFSLPGHHARHNTNYWRGVPYLGVGPSAHSFDGPSRQWNVANNAKYMKAIDNQTLAFEKEILSPADQHNEYIMTALRTKWGVDLSFLEKRWGTAVAQEFEHGMTEVVARKEAERDGPVFRLTKRGRLLADGIAAGLFLES